MTKETKKIISRIFSYALVAAIFAILAKIIINDWQQIGSYDFSLKPVNLFWSFCFAFLNIYSLAALWRYLFSRFDRENTLSRLQGFRIFIYAWLSRYLPGRFWAPLGKIYFGAKEGIGKKALGLASIFEFLLSSLSHFVLAWAILLFVFSDYFPVAQYTIIFLISVAVIVLILERRVFSFLINFALRRIGKMEVTPDECPGYGQMLKVIILYFFPNFFVAASFVFLSLSFYDFSLWQGLLLLCAFIVANFLAKVAFFIPLGIGVREGVLVAILQFFLPLPLATLAALMSRVWFIAVDAVIFGGVFSVSRFQLANSNKNKDHGLPS